MECKGVVYPFTLFLIECSLLTEFPFTYFRRNSSFIHSFIKYMHLKEDFIISSQFFQVFDFIIPVKKIHGFKRN